MTVSAPHDKVIVTLVAPEEKTASGLFLIDDAREKSVIGIVVSSGWSEVNDGEKVVLSGAYAGSPFTIDGVEYITVVKEEILAVVE